MKGQLTKKICFCLVLLVVLLAWIPVAGAQSYPTKPITIVVPMAAGAATDVLLRNVQKVLPKYLEQPLVVDLRPGAGGAIGTDFVAKAAPDGYTLLGGGPGWNSTLPAIENRSKGPDDLDAVCQINSSSSFTLVRTESPFKTFQDVIAYVKANPGKLSYGHTGIWGAADLFWKEVKLQYGITTRDVSHEGGGQMMMALLGGHIDIGTTAPPAAMPQIQAGKLRPLMYNTDRKFTAMPQVPSTSEVGVKARDNFWRGVLVPKGTPKPVIDKLAAAFKKVTEDKEFIDLIAQFGEEPGYLGPEELTKMWIEEFNTRKELGRILK